MRIDSIELISEAEKAAKKESEQTNNSDLDFILNYKPTKREPNTNPITAASAEKKELEQELAKEEKTFKDRSAPNNEELKKLAKIKVSHDITAAVATELQNYVETTLYGHELTALENDKIFDDAEKNLSKKDLSREAKQAIIKKLEAKIADKFLSDDQVEKYVRIMEKDMDPKLVAQYREARLLNVLNEIAGRTLPQDTTDKILAEIDDNRDGNDFEQHLFLEDLIKRLHKGKLTKEEIEKRIEEIANALSTKKFGDIRSAYMADISQRTDPLKKIWNDTLLKARSHRGWQYVTRALQASNVEKSFYDLAHKTNIEEGNPKDAWLFYFILGRILYSVGDKSTTATVRVLTSEQREAGGLPYDTVNIGDLLGAKANAHELYPLFNSLSGKAREAIKQLAITIIGENAEKESTVVANCEGASSNDTTFMGALKKYTEFAGKTKHSEAFDATTTCYAVSIALAEMFASLTGQKHEFPTRDALAFFLNTLSGMANAVWRIADKDVHTNKLEGDEPDREEDNEEEKELPDKSPSPEQLFIQGSESADFTRKLLSSGNEKAAEKHIEFLKTLIKEIEKQITAAKDDPKLVKKLSEEKEDLEKQLASLQNIYGESDKEKQIAAVGHNLSRGIFNIIDTIGRSNPVDALFLTSLLNYGKSKAEDLTIAPEESPRGSAKTARGEIYWNTIREQLMDEWVTFLSVKGASNEEEARRRALAFYLVLKLSKRNQQILVNDILDILNGIIHNLGDKQTAFCSLMEKEDGIKLIKMLAADTFKFLIGYVKQDKLFNDLEEFGIQSAKLKSRAKQIFVPKKPFDLKELAEELVDYTFHDLAKYAGEIQKQILDRVFSESSSMAKWYEHLKDEGVKVPAAKEALQLTPSQRAEITFMMKLPGLDKSLDAKDYIITWIRTGAFLGQMTGDGIESKLNSKRSELLSRIISHAQGIFETISKDVADSVDAQSIIEQCRTVEKSRLSQENEQ